MTETTPLSPALLRTLYKLLGRYAAEVRIDQPMASEIIELLRRWVKQEERFDQ